MDMGHFDYFVAGTLVTLDKKVERCCSNRQNHAGSQFKASGCKTVKRDKKLWGDKSFSASVE